MNIIRKLIPIMLAAVMLLLLMPIVIYQYQSETAFTADNLIVYTHAAPVP